MNYYIQQSIQINVLKIGAISNSSVFQIGSAGMIKGSSHLYNTGGFTGPAPDPVKPDGEIDLENLSDSYLTMPSVPLTAP